MIYLFLNHLFLTITVTLLIVLGIGCQIMIGVIYQNMMKATDNMTVTENKLLKQCKLKYMNCYKMNGGILNVSVFVDKFLSKIHVGGMSLTSISHLGGQLMLLSVFVNGIGIARMLSQENGFLELAPFYMLSILGLYLYFGVTSFVDAPQRRRDLKVNLIDYLENHLSVRMKEVDVSRKTLEGMEKKESALVLEAKEKGGREELQKQTNPAQKEIFTQKEAEEIERLVKELFITQT